MRCVAVDGCWPVAILGGMFMNPGAGMDLLGIPWQVVFLGGAIVGFVVGIAWLRRITSADDDSGDWWRFRR